MQHFFRVHPEIEIDAAPESVWSALRDVGALHQRLAPGFVTDVRMEDAGRARVVTFGNGLVARELIVDLDERTRRLGLDVIKKTLESSDRR